MFDTNNLPKNEKGGNTSWMNVGVHRGCTVQSVEIRPTTSNKLIETTYKNPMGEVQNHTIWFPRLDDVKVPEGKSREQAVTDAGNRFMEECLDIIRELNPGQDVRLRGENIQKFAEDYKAKALASKGKVDVVVERQSEKFGRIPRYDAIKRHNAEAPYQFKLDKFDMSSAVEAKPADKDDMPF